MEDPTNTDISLDPVDPDTPMDDLTESVPVAAETDPVVAQELLNTEETSMVKMQMAIIRNFRQFFVTEKAQDQFDIAYKSMEVEALKLEIEARDRLIDSLRNPSA